MEGSEYSSNDLQSLLPDTADLLLRLNDANAAMAEYSNEKSELEQALVNEKAEKERILEERDALLLELNPPRYLAKLVVIERLADVGLADAAWAALNADAGLLEAWNEAGPNKANVKDERVPAFITQIGADPAVILAS